MILDLMHLDLLTKYTQLTKSKNSDYFIWLIQTSKRIKKSISYFFQYWKK